MARLNSNASAVVIGANYLLSVAHPGIAIGGTVWIGSTAYNIAEATFNGTADVCLFRVANMDGSLPQLSTYVSYSTDLMGDYNYTAVVGGFGQIRGTTLTTTGASGTAYGYTWATASTATLLWGQNVVVGAATIVNSDIGTTTSGFRANFDGPSATSHVDYEASLAWGDSGGGWFKNVSGTWVLTGLSASVSHTNGGDSDPTNQSWFDNPNTGPVDGDVNYAVRVSVYSSWLSQGQNRWLTDADGTWGTTSNWSYGAPVSSGSFATFDGTLTGTRTFTVAATASVGTIRFLTDATCRIVGTQALAFNAGSTGTGAFIYITGTDATSSQYIETPVILKKPLTIRMAGSSSLTLSGNVSGSGGIAAIGGQLELDGSNSFTGTSSVQNTTVLLNSSSAFGAGPLVLASNATLLAVGTSRTLGNSVIMTYNPNLVGSYALTFSGTVDFAGGTQRTLNISASAYVTFAGNVCNGGVIKHGAGTLALTGTLTYTGTTSVAMGTLLLNSPLPAGNYLSVAVGTARIGAAQTLGTLAISGSAHVATEQGTTLVGSLQIAGSATPTASLDLRGNAFVWDYTSTSSYAAAGALVAAGYNNGTWTGRGIRDTTIDSPSSYALAVFDNATMPNGPVGSFGGRAVDSSSVLIRKVIAGDVNGDGAVNTDDYFYIDFNLGSIGGGWMAGDLNYDGQTNTDDYFYIDFDLGASAAYADWTGPLAGMSEGLQFAGVAPAAYDQGVTDSGSVPEPATALLLLGGASILLARGRAVSPRARRAARLRHIR